MKIWVEKLKKEVDGHIVDGKEVMTINQVLDQTGIRYNNLRTKAYAGSVSYIEIGEGKQPTRLYILDSVIHLFGKYPTK